MLAEYKNNNGSKIIEIKENGIYNKIEYKVSGDMYLNDGPITVKSYDENKHLISDKILNIYDESLELRAQRTWKWEKLPSGITDNDLPTHLGMTTKVVTFTNATWAGITTGVIVAILTSPFPGLWNAVAGIIASSLVNSAQRLNPSSSYLSMEKYERKGMYVGGYNMIIKTYMKYFATQNFTAFIGDSTHYTAYDG